MENQWTITSKCSATGKTRYATPKEANQALLRIKAKKNMYNTITYKRYKRRQGRPDQCRSYYCKHCKGFHLTSSVTPVKNRTIEKQFYERVKKTTGLVVSESEALAWKADGLPFPEPNLNI